MTERRGKRILAAAILAVLIAIALLPSGYFTVEPGPVSSLAGLIAVDGYPRPTASFFMVSIKAREARLFEAVEAMFTRNTALWSKAAVYGGTSPEEYVEESRVAMEESQKTAVRLAFTESGLTVGPGPGLPPSVSIASGEVMGPSAGLAFALEIISTLTGADLSQGRKVAATGTLGQDGTVRPVGGIAQKAAACASEGIDLFLVPAENEAEARRFAGAAKVKGVRDLSEAVRYLRGDDIP